MLYKAKQHNLDIEGFVHMIDSSAINHVIKNHGNVQTEQNRGNIAITDNDFSTIAEVLSNPEQVIYGGNNEIGRNTVVSIKSMNDGSTVVITEVRTGKKKLALNSMRRYPSNVPLTSILKGIKGKKEATETAHAVQQNEPLSPTSETLPSGGLSIVDNPQPRNFAPQQPSQAVADKPIIQETNSQNGNEAQPTEPVKQAEQTKAVAQLSGNSRQLTQPTAQTKATAEQEAHRQYIQDTIATATGEDLANHINVVNLNDILRPDNAKDLLSEGGEVEGFYNPQTQQITIIADNVDSTTASLVAWHELGHRGIDTKGFHEFKTILERADNNPTIKALADKLVESRAGTVDEAINNRLVAIEEAVVELYAAMKTNDWQAIEDKYNITIPEAMRAPKGTIGRIIDHIKQLIGKVFGIDQVSDQHIFSLLNKVDNAVHEDGQTQSEGQNRFSLNESNNSAFAKAVDAVVRGETAPTNYIKMGTTPPILEKIGLPKTGIFVRGGVLQKVMKEKHAVSSQSLKDLPKQINNPVAVMQSAPSATRTGHIVLTELTEQEKGIDKPIVAILHLNHTSKGIEVLNIASVYGRSLPQIQKALDNDLLYWNKTKGSQFINAFGLQLPSKSRLDASLSDADNSPQTPTNQAQDENIRYSRKANEEQNLVAMHNLTADNLIHADKMGGLAVPSLAVGRTDKGFTGFGEITLIADKSMIDPERQGNQTYNADVYSPRYPTVHNSINQKAFNQLLDEANQKIADYGDHAISPASMGLEHGNISQFQRNPVVQLAYLLEKGIAPKPKHQQSPVPPSLRKYAGQDPLQLAKDPQFQQAVKAHYIKEKGAEVANHLFAKEEAVDNLSRRMAYIAVDYQGTKQADWFANNRAIDKAIQKNKQDYQQWAHDKWAQIVQEEKIFKGYSPSGKKRYIPHTIDNVVKEMKGNIQGGEGVGGAGYLKGSVAKQFKSIADIQANRNKIVSPQEMKAIKDEIANAYSELKDKIQPYYRYSGAIDDGAIAEYAKTGKLTDFNRLPENLRQELDDFIAKVRNAPTEYFEAKPQRAVGLSEFVGAVVPNNTPQKVLDILEKNGIAIQKYNPNKAEDRKQKVALSAKRQGVRFSRRTAEQEDLAQKATRIFDGEPVAELTGTEFAKDETSLIDKVVDFFNSIGNKVMVQGIGEVSLNRQSVRDSLAHGIGRNKAIAFKAVPDILTRGEIIDHQENWKGRGYDSFTISAPITIQGERYIAVAIINEATEKGNHRFYLHEVALQKSLLSDEFKTGIDTRSPQGDILNILQKLVESKNLWQSTRGAYRPDTRTIALLESADLTTFQHELAHHFLETNIHVASQLQEAESLSESEQQVLADVETTLQWLGIADLARWHDMDLDEKRQAHEQYARGFEAYLFEGKTPSPELRSVFARMRAWAVSVYRTLTALDVNLNDDIRAVFDRLVATDAQIQQAQQEQAMARLFATADEAGMNLLWLATGEGAKFKDGLNEPSKPLNNVLKDTLGNSVDADEFVFIPRYDIQAATGSGYPVDNEQPRFSMAFRKYWVINYLGADAKDLSVIAVKGDSMEGILNDKDSILVNHAKNMPGNGLYVLRIGNSLLVKHTQIMPGNRLLVKSANETYEPFELDLTQDYEDIAIIGKVVWFGRTL